MPRPFGLGRLPSRRELETVQTLNISSLQWLVGAFIATLGALMLVSPHQFAAPTYAYLVSDVAKDVTGQIFISAGGFVGRFDRPTPSIVAYRDHHDAQRHADRAA